MFGINKSQPNESVCIDCSNVCARCGKNKVKNTLDWCEECEKLCCCCGKKQKVENGLCADCIESLMDFDRQMQEKKQCPMCGGMVCGDDYYNGLYDEFKWVCIECQKTHSDGWELKKFAGYKNFYNDKISIRYCGKFFGINCDDHYVKCKKHCHTCKNVKNALKAFRDKKWSSK